MKNIQHLLEISKKLGESGCEDAINKMGKILKTVMGKGVNEKDAREKFLDMVVLSCRNLEILGGGKNLKETFKKFVDNYLGLKISGKILQLNNMELSNLSNEELLFVFGWARRIAKTKNMPKIPKPNKKNKFERTIAYSSKSKDYDDEFNPQFSKLKGLKF